MVVSPRHRSRSPHGGLSSVHNDLYATVYTTISTQSVISYQRITSRAPLALIRIVNVTKITPKLQFYLIGHAFRHLLFPYTFTNVPMKCILSNCPLAGPPGSPPIGGLPRKPESGRPEAGGGGGPRQAQAQAQIHGHRALPLHLRRPPGLPAHTG